jgi:1-deoxy-D-xylulose-5-phosphate synthase
VVATLEDHALRGGYGSAVLELFSESQVNSPVLRLAWPDEFIEHASSVDYLREKHGLTATALTERIRKCLGSVASRREKSGGLSIASAS